MKITTDHASSSYGLPVILGDDGEVMDYAPGVRAARATLGFTRAELGARVNAHPRTVEGWEQGRRPVPAAALNVIGSLLARAPAELEDLPG